MTRGNLLRGTLATLIAGGISTAAFLAIGIGLPNWIYGSGMIKNSPEGSTVLSVFLSFGSVYALLAFVLLTVFVYRRLSPQMFARKPLTPERPMFATHLRNEMPTGLRPTAPRES